MSVPGTRSDFWFVCCPHVAYQCKLAALICKVRTRQETQQILYCLQLTLIIRRCPLSTNSMHLARLWHLTSMRAAKMLMLFSVQEPQDQARDAECPMVSAADLRTVFAEHKLNNSNVVLAPLYTIYTHAKSRPDKQKS